MASTLLHLASLVARDHRDDGFCVFRVPSSCGAVDTGNVFPKATAEASHKAGPWAPRAIPCLGTARGDGQKGTAPLQEGGLHRSARKQSVRHSSDRGVCQG